MIALSDLIKEFETDLFKSHVHEMLPGHLKALDAMKCCRTNGSFLMAAECEECDYHGFFPHSCGHRNCPHCQYFDCQQWLERQREKLLPVDYFMITFTLPAQLRTMAWFNQKVVYSLLFSLAWETLKTFGLNDPELLGQIAATAVLHTNTRALNYHPHVHFVIPAGAVDKKHRLWRKKSGKFLFHEQSLAKVFHAKWIDAINKSDLSVKETIPDHWIVNCKYVGHGNRALTYLGKYLYRGVLPEKNIIQNKAGMVTFSYIDNDDVQRTRTLPGGEFLWLLLKHVLPRGFRRARDYGFLHANAKKLIRFVQYVLRVTVPPKTDTESKRPKFCCSRCGGAMRIIATRLEPDLNGPAFIHDT